MLRSLTALLLLGIFLTIHVTKALHKHPSSLLTQVAGATEKVEASSDCAVCDYHFTKDCCNNVATIELFNETLYQPVVLFYKSPLVSSIGLHYSDRGPPALS
ncbi:MAG TPA: hypothetical protein VD794_02000 [Flavisolibacter sp.]|nr:hypothetical protein [Flavisolibacter sp.]